MKKLPEGVGFFLIWLCLLPVQETFAEFYRYLDDKGTVCLTDRIQAVPEKYRKDVVVVNVGDDVQSGSRTKDGEGSETREKKAVSPADIMKGARNVFEYPWVRWVFGAAAFILIFSLIGRVCSFLDHKQIGSFLRILFTAGVLLYLLQVHSKEVVNAFTLMKEELFSVKDRVEEKNQVTGDLIKESPESTRH